MKKIEISPFESDSSAFVTEVKTTEKLLINNIECVFSDKVHSKLFTKDGRTLRVRKSMNEWEQILPSKAFLRINRSVIINLNYVKKICKSGNQTLLITMQDYDKQLIMSRNYSVKLKGTLIF